MEFFEFEKSLLTRLEESTDVLCWKNETVPASRVRSEWAYYIELQIEPTGWQALWKVPRVICEELDLKYPTVVFGTVKQVLFKELKAIFLVLAVQDDDVQLPEEQEVNLEDLWPTKKQENKDLNIEKTADCIDRLRFFYNHVWMPWDNDNDDDLDWGEKHLQSRIRFCYDLKRKDMKRSLSAHIRTLLVEAQYIQKRREYLEIDLNDDEGLEDILDKTQITDLMRLHLRLTMIKSELEMLENPEMRKIYEEIKFDEDKCLKNSAQSKGKGKMASVYIVSTPFTMKEQLHFMQVAKQFIEDEKIVQMCTSLQDVLNICSPSDDIFLSSGKHTIKFLEYLNDDGCICGLSPVEVKYTVENDINENDATIMSQDDDSILLVFDGNFTLKNLTIDCRNIRCGILVKNGYVRLENCRIIGDSKSSIKQGVVCSGKSKLSLNNCLIQDFANGILLHDVSEVTVKDSCIHRCRIGIEMSDGNNVVFENAVISESNKYGICFETNQLSNKVNRSNLIINGLCNIESDTCENIPWKGNCVFENNLQGNIVLKNKRFSKFPNLNEYNLSDSFESNGLDMPDASTNGESAINNDIKKLEPTLSDSFESSMEVIVVNDSVDGDSI